MQNGKELQKKSKYLFKKEFGNCSILKAIDDLNSYIKSTHNTVRSFFDSGTTTRRDEFLIDDNSFREGWVNACLHNDYSTHLGPAVYLFSDHLEIFSYGNPLSVQSKEDFLKGVSVPINPELAGIFMKIDKAEESGKGINTIVNKYGEGVFEFSETHLTINIPYNPLALDNKNTQAGEETGEENIVLSNNEMKVYEIIKNNVMVTRKEIMEQANLSKNTVDRIIKSLKDKGLILGKTSDKGGYWIIK